MKYYADFQWERGGRYGGGKWGGCGGWRGVGKLTNVVLHEILEPHI